MKEYFANCHTEVDETKFNQNQVELKNRGIKSRDIPQVICSECFNSK